MTRKEVEIEIERRWGILAYCYRWPDMDGGVWCIVAAAAIPFGIGFGDIDRTKPHGKGRTWEEALEAAALMEPGGTGSGR